MITPVKFMVFNGLLLLGLLYAIDIFFGPGRHLGAAALVGIVYFWLSLWRYTEWFMWASPIEKADERDIRAIISECTNNGPYGRTTSHVRRVMRSRNEEKRQLVRARMHSLYQRLLDLSPEDERAASGLKEWMDR